MAEPTVAELVATGGADSVRTPLVETIPAVDLASWAAGYVAGYDTAAAGAIEVALRRLAEDLAELDRTTYILPGRLARDRRIAAEVADDGHQFPVTQTDDWPAVTIPGGGS